MHSLCLWISIKTNYSVYFVNHSVNWNMFPIKVVSFLISLIFGPNDPKRPKTLFF